MKHAQSETDPRRFQLSHRDFQQLAKFINGHCGIRMPPAKKVMVEGRLRRRVRDLGFTHMGDYCDFLFQQDGLSQEGDYIIDAVTTNKTDFFREAEHFHYLAETVLPHLAQKGGIGIQSPLRLWSVAASIGAEAFSLAMVADDYAQAHRGFRYSVLATDICLEVLEKAAQAIYPTDMAAAIPPPFRRRYVMRSRDSARHEVRIVPELRQNVQFAKLNLNDSNYPLPHAMHVAFCRNVLIYFDKPMQEAVLHRICAHLLPGGYLFIGHSETVAGYNLPLRQVAPTIFERM